MHNLLATAMTADSEAFPPPNNPDDFESLCLDLWKDIWHDPGAQKNGRRGQPQAGVDVYGRQGGRLVGVQCKQKDGLLRRKVTIKELEHEVSEAQKFEPKLTSFILATTGPADVKVQQRARELTETHLAQGLFTVEVWSWERIWHEVYGREDLLRRVGPIYWPRYWKLVEERLRPITQCTPSLPAGSGENVDPHARVTESSEASFVRYDLGDLEEQADPFFQGRVTELQAVWHAWNDPNVVVLQIDAGPGFGKSALTRQWLDKFRTAGRPDCTRALGYSFYNTGQNSYQDNANQWLEKACGHFDVTPMPDHDLGIAIAEEHIVCGGLIVLDGLEPVLEKHGAYSGYLRQDPGLEAMFRHLNSEGERDTDRAKRLLIITTRVRYRLFTTESSHVRLLKLEPLSDHDAASFLQCVELPDHTKLFVGPHSSKGTTASETTDKLFAEIAEEFECHPLTLAVMASYILKKYNGNLAMRHEIPDPVRKATGGKLPKDIYSRHAQRVFAACEKLLQEAELASLELLCILSLFNRPVPRDLMDVVMSKNIGGISTSLRPETFQKAVDELEELHLVSKVGAFADPRLTCHPLIRGYFRDRFQKNCEHTWLRANQVLSKHYCESVDHAPAAKEKWGQDVYERLYLAVVHGCAGGDYDHVFHEVYRKYITEQDVGTATRRFGTFGLEWSVLCCFFGEKLGVDYPAPEKALLRCEEDRIVAVRCLGFCLWKLGRVGNAERYLRWALDRARELHQIESRTGKAVEEREGSYNAAITTRNLVNLLTDRCQFPQAVDLGEQNLIHADECREGFFSYAIRCSLGMACIYMGACEKAGAFFEGAKLKAQQRSSEGRLTLLPLCHYCAYLTEIGEGEKAIALLDEGLSEIDKSADLGLAHLAMASANISLADKERSKVGIGKALEQANAAIEYLNQAGRADTLPDAHVIRAMAYYLRNQQDDWARAEKDVRRALELADQAANFRSETWAFVVEGLLWCAALHRGETVRCREECLTKMALCENKVKETGYESLNDLCGQMTALIEGTAE